jgi:hypothetical protein
MTAKALSEGREPLGKTSACEEDKPPGKVWQANFISLSQEPQLKSASVKYSSFIDCYPFLFMDTNVAEATPFGISFTSRIYKREVKEHEETQAEVRE